MVDIVSTGKERVLTADDTFGIRTGRYPVCIECLDRNGGSGVLCVALGERLRVLGYGTGRSAMHFSFDRKRTYLLDSPFSECPTKIEKAEARANNKAVKDNDCEYTSYKSLAEQDK